MYQLPKKVGCIRQLIFKRWNSEFLPNWVESDMQTKLKSRFKGYCIPIRSEQDIQPALNQLLQLHKKIGKATHPAMYAWKIVDSNSMKVDTCSMSKRKKHSRSSSEKYKLKTENNERQMCVIRHPRNLRIGHNDCKEPGSGDRLMGLLDRLRLVNVLVAVTRWYGGKLLGPSRFRCISDSALDALQKAGYTGIGTDKNSWLNVYMIAKLNSQK